MMQDMGERVFCFVLGGALPVAMIGFPSLPVEQRSLNGPAPSCPQVAVVPKASRAIAPRTRTFRMSGGLLIPPSRGRPCETYPVPQGLALRSGAVSVLPAEQVYPTAWLLDPVAPAVCETPDCMLRG